MACQAPTIVQPAAKERQRESVIESNKARAADPVTADRRFMDSTPTPQAKAAEQRKSTAEAAKATGASTRAVDASCRAYFKNRKRSNRLA